MKLVSISYSDQAWQLENLQLGQLNLIVARNATGKSRTLFTIDLLVKIFIQKRSIVDSNWIVDFLDAETNRLKFSFSAERKKNEWSIQEKLEWNNEVVLSREKGVTQLKNFVTGEIDTVFPPENKLTLHANRDIKKYPFLEKLNIWAERSFYFKFAEINSETRSAESDTDAIYQLEDIPQLYDKIIPTSKEWVKNALRDCGYNLVDISVEDKGRFKNLIFRETKDTEAVFHFDLSQGMYRAFAILVYLEYLSSRENPSTIAIDDFCEGLDFDRATKLGKLVFQYCETNGIQLIATSNDSFLMDVVNIKYWNILQRKGKVVAALNIVNSKEKFEEFKFTGLSNFDFFSSDYLLRTNE